MNRAEVLKRVAKALGEQTDVSTGEIHENATFEDLGMDSLDAVEGIMALEEEFNIEISDEDAESLRSVSAVVDYLLAKA